MRALILPPLEDRCSTETRAPTQKRRITIQSIIPRTRGWSHMKVLILGATGMVGQGVLRECLLDPTVERVVTLGRSGTGQTDQKITELVHANLFDLSAIEAQLTGFVSPGGHRPAARRTVEDRLVSMAVCRAVAGASVAEARTAAIRHDDGADGASDAPRGSRRISEAAARGAGHRRALAGRAATRGISVWRQRKPWEAND